MRIGESISAYDFFSTKYYHVTLSVYLFYAGPDNVMFQFHLTVNYSTKSYHRRTILWNAVHPLGFIDAIIMPEATLAAATASVSHYY